MSVAKLFNSFFRFIHKYEPIPTRCRCIANSFHNRSTSKDNDGTGVAQYERALERDLAEAIERVKAKKRTTRHARIVFQTAPEKYFRLKTSRRSNDSLKSSRERLRLGKPRSNLRYYSHRAKAPDSSKSYWMRMLESFFFPTEERPRDLNRRSVRKHVSDQSSGGMDPAASNRLRGPRLILKKETTKEEEEEMMAAELLRRQARKLEPARINPPAIALTERKKPRVKRTPSPTTAKKPAMKKHVSIKGKVKRAILEQMRNLARSSEAKLAAMEEEGRLDFKPTRRRIQRKSSRYYMARERQDGDDEEYYSCDEGYDRPPGDIHFLPSKWRYLLSCSEPSSKVSVRNLSMKADGDDNFHRGSSNCRRDEHHRNENDDRRVQAKQVQEECDGAKEKGKQQTLPIEITDVMAKAKGVLREPESSSDGELESYFGDCYKNQQYYKYKRHSFYDMIRSIQNIKRELEEERIRREEERIRMEEERKRQEKEAARIRELEEKARRRKEEEERIAREEACKREKEKRKQEAERRKTIEAARKRREEEECRKREEEESRKKREEECMKKEQEKSRKKREEERMKKEQEEHMKKEHEESTRKEQEQHIKKEQEAKSPCKEERVKKLAMAHKCDPLTLEIIQEACKACKEEQIAEESKKQKCSEKSKEKKSSKDPNDSKSSGKTCKL